MQENSITDMPKLLKARQWHSRFFAVAIVALLLVSQPRLTADVLLREAMLWLGYALVIIGVLGRAYASAYIGGRKNETVMRDGPFSIVRNPLYVASFLAVCGVGLQSGMLTVFITLVAAFLLYYPLVVAKEEKFLYHRFGEDYARYMQEVPRWIPNFTLWREPESIELKPKFLRRTLMDAAIFFLPMPCFALIAKLQAAALLPVWLVLS